MPKTQARTELVDVAAALREQGLDELADRLSEVADGLAEAEAFDQMLLAAVDSLTEGLAIVDRQGRILFVNAEGQRLVGEVNYQAGPAEWSDEFGLYEPDGITHFPVERNPMALAVRGKPASEAEMMIRNRYLPEQEGVLLRVSAAPVFGATEQLGAVDVFRDITEEKRAQRALVDALGELRAVDESRRDFIAVASHELKAPAAAAASAMATLTRHWDKLDDATKLKLLGQVDGVARRMLLMIDDLLTTSKLDLGAVRVDAVPLGLSELVEQVRTELSMPDVEVRLEPSVTVLADAGHVRRIVTNYLTNAEKYGAAPYVVTVETTQKQAFLRVLDAGAGVPAEFVPRLFSRFARASVTDTEGSGLGLNIVRGLAQANGGEAWYEPVAPHGSCFALSLPLA